ncbi:phosphoinositide-interacting protein [Microcaecilia unicolor]|uniref:Phosphoinositide-interacting protein n=1 Tax=Microcaecilia unicolor TaxID=1415580 RepID=A0A6P7YGE8_9AMPH|nr:phosphoinositide-interacting protein [Microcaecilia unicolor]
METLPANLAVSEQISGEGSSSESKDLITSQTESTLFSSSRSESLWTTSLPKSAWDTYQKPIIIMSVGGAAFLLGVILTSIHFVTTPLKPFNATNPKEITKPTVPKLFGPAFLSIGLMVLVVGLVWVPIIRKKKKQRSASRLFHHPRQFFHF